ncbi:MAG: AAA family ATPase [Candidatus Nealsonbacteria bacterium]|nr:AAA family ATPase [Candidatus Nealsonbacteria bacterium]
MFAVKIVLFSAASRQFPVILVSGLRQVGKTTLLQHAAEADRRYVTLDDPQARTLAESPTPITETVWAIPVSEI